MVPLRLVLLIVAFVFFFLAACGVTHSRINLVAAGLACWVVTLFLG